MSMRGTTAKGFPSPAEEELSDAISFDDYLIPNKDSSYILKMKGEAMEDVGILDGDMIIVERKSTAAPGQIVVALVEDEYVIRHLRKRNGQFYLEPTNSGGDAIPPSEAFSIEAVVTALVRKY